MDDLSYSVAIRTLGTAGEKYQRLLDSIAKQTIRPEKIVVVLPEGYALPHEQMGTEQFVYCKKGMVIQRLEALKYIDSKYTIFCDDDIEFGSDFVEKLLEPMERYDYSCTLGPLIELFNPDNFKYLIASLLGAGCTMIKGRDKQYARVLRTGGCSHNKKVDTTRHKIYDTDSFAWACFCIKTEVFRKIRLEDENWIDRTGYAAFDDQTMAYKLRVNGYRIGVVSDALFIHNDGKTSMTNIKLEPIYAHAFNHYVFWHRFLYSLSDNMIERLWMLICVNYYIGINTIYSIALYIIGRRTKEQIKMEARGFSDAKKYVKSQEYKDLKPVVVKENENAN